MITKRHYLALLIGAGLLAGCGDSDVQEVNQWMEQTKKETKVDVQPLTEPTTFVPFAYSTVGQIDPYDPNKLLAELARTSGANNPLKPDDNRPKEVLEAFPLDTMSMVGSMKSKGVMYALVQIDKTMYHVKPGDRVGQNFGIITGVSDEAISIKETVQDAGGEWIERPTKLELQESKEKK
ncbi:pilus assembly protein PilP [Massilia genomosp. 1]|uniref:Pilus assembly protein PilP n=1 Tax=Massilia genomosp. 1 TaxID=2609280 RepID=A0ABX0MPH1_9BURK|nr:pilus assembly protein PilP [Massilia genomosp. 1]NHZ62271.1 pilus assembly protein PilP [Massilia genomosp. 1]